MKRLLTWLILLAILGFAAYKGAVWWLADQRLAELRMELEPAGVLDRGSVSSGLDGHIRLTNASWQDFRLTRPLDIGHIVFDAGSPLTLLEVLADPARLPSQWSLQADGLGMVLEPTMFRNWVTAEGRKVDGKPALIQLSCAPDPRQQLGSGDLMRMGITGLAGEALVQQQADGVHAELNTAGTGSLELQWDGARIDLMSLDTLLSNTRAPMIVTVRDGGLMRRVAAYCSREVGVETGDWASQAASDLEAALEARGMTASGQLLALYRQWLTEGGELTVALHPSKPWFGIPVHDAGAEADGADWRVEYNGSVVPDVFLQTIAAEPEQPSSKPPLQEPEQSGDAKVQRWYADPVEQAANWVGHRVRITLSNGNVVEGRLVGVTDQELEVARVVAGGEVTYPMKLRAVTGFEVWRRGHNQ